MKNIGKMTKEKVKNIRQHRLMSFLNALIRNPELSLSLGYSAPACHMLSLSGGQAIELARAAYRSFGRAA